MRTTRVLGRKPEVQLASLLVEWRRCLGAGHRCVAKVEGERTEGKGVGGLIGLAGGRISGRAIQSVGWKLVAQ